ncbi:MAG: fatty acid desaturase [Rhizobiales bacterium]|nr:fatty acid desaturase [Hyphomicrobiales bacterium]
MTQSDQNAAHAASDDAAQWTRILNNYRDPRFGRSLFEIAVTLVPFVALWVMSWAAIQTGYWWTLPVLWLVAALFQVRLFLIQHDCGHGSFFRNRKLNDWIGRCLGVLTLTPYDFWRRSHALHHASTGHLDRRGFGDIDTLTVREFKELPFGGRLKYRLYRHPLVLFGIGPAYLFILRQRIPVGLIGSPPSAWFSTMATNAAIVGVVGGVIWLVGWQSFLLVQLPITALAGSIGVWLFYVQHQFEDTVWAREGDWDLHEAALHGSSHYDLPKVLRWFTANIGVHHVHHLCSRIPYYNLQKVLREHPDLSQVSRLTLFESFRCVRLVLWCEEQRQLISFRDARAMA